MCVYRPKGSKAYWMDFRLFGTRFHENTYQTSKTLAREAERNRKEDLRRSAAGLEKRPAPKLFSTAAQEWIEAQAPFWSPRSLMIAKNSLTHLDPVFGRQLVIAIEADDIRRYQQARLQAGACGHTINMEFAALRGVLRHSGLWERLQSKRKVAKLRNPTSEDTR